MAFDFSKLNFFSRLDARARVLVLFGGIIGIGVLIYVLATMMSSGSATTGPSSVAGAPQGLQSVPGGKLTPEYYRALMQANTQASQQAQISGGSAVPTIVNAGQQTTAEGGCTVLCGDESADVKNDLNDWVKQGKISADVSTELQNLAAKNVSVDEYAAELDRLVREGKLTPEQARMLLEEYKKQHMNHAIQDSAKVMDDYIKSGKLSLDAANQLLALQKRNASPAEYSALLQELVRQGKIDPETAQRLLAQYMQQRSKDIIARSVTSIKQMTRAGQLTPDVEKTLIDMEERMVPVDEYAGKLQGFLDAGKITPIVSSKILEEFKQQKRDIGNVSSIGALIKQAEDDAYKELSDLLRAGKITKGTAGQISDMIQKNVPFDTFQSSIYAMVQAGQLTPDISKLKLADYKKIKDLRDLAGILEGLRGNNAPCSDTEDALKQAVQANAITAEQAAQLMKECQAGQIQAQPSATGPSSDALAQLQERLQSTSTETQPAVSTEAGTFAEAQAQSQQDLEQARQTRIDDLMTAMQGQAGQLISAWQPPVMMHKEASPIDKAKANDGADAAGGSAAASAAGAGAVMPTPAVVIKGGTILFAVLDTAVNSDYPDSPVMATIVYGPFKGAKMLGKLITTKGVSGQMDRVTLNFTMMNLDSWPKSKTVTSYAIDPDTARTVLASNVNYHYMQRFGALMATSFLQGYGTAVMSSGSSTSSTPGSSGVLTQSNPQLSPSNKLAVAFGQMAQAVGQATKNYTERPPTVVVDSGVGLGILFMTDVT